VSGERAFAAPLRPVVAALVEAMLADNGPDGHPRPPPPADVARIVDDFDDWIAHAGPRLTAALSAALLALDLAPPALRLRPGRLRSLPLAERIELLERMENHPSTLVTMLFVAVKIPLTLVLYEEGDQLATTGFDRPSLAHRRRLATVPS